MVSRVWRAHLAGAMGSAPEESTGGSDETGVSGKGTSGTCHVCGGALRRGNVNLARQCVTCKTRYHASDCGKRRSNAGYGKPYDVCPKCAAQCKCVGGDTKCHTSTVRVARIRKRVAASCERTDPYRGSTATRRTGESVWVRRPSASDPGLGRKPTQDSLVRSSSMRVGASFLGTLNEAGRMCEPVAEDAEKAAGQKAEPPRRRSSELARGAAAAAAAQSLHDSPELALPQVDDLFDWPGALLRMAVNEAGDGIVDETRVQDSGGTRRDDVRFGGAPLRLDADAGTPSPPFGARLPGHFSGIPACDFGGDGVGLGGFPGIPVGGGFPGSPVGDGFPGSPVGDGGPIGSSGGGSGGEFTMEHARLMRGIMEGTVAEEEVHQ